MGRQSRPGDQPGRSALSAGEGEWGGVRRKEQAWELDLTSPTWCYLPPAISILLPNDALLGYIRVHYVFIEYALCCQVCPFLKFILIFFYYSELRVLSAVNICC